MKQALNFSPQAIEALRSYPFVGQPIMRAAYRWIADMLEQAEVFLLPDCGELLDRGKPKPEVPGLMFKPPFPIVACEYTAQKARPGIDFYTAVPCSKRISLAWEWTGDLPYPLSAVPELVNIRPGVAVISIFYVDHSKTWVCNSGASHLAFDGEWMPYADNPTPFVNAMIERGAISKEAARARGFETSPIPLMVEHMLHAAAQLGSREAVFDSMLADNNDEVNAYVDLCYALACKNVSMERTSPSKMLNRERRRKGRPDLKDFHILSIGDGAGGSGAAPFADRNGPRSHLRRGHIRRLGADRVTWVNQTMVHGHGGFVTKKYQMKGAA